MRDVQDSDHAQQTTPEPPLVGQLRSEIAALTERLQTAESTLTSVRRAYAHALEQLQLLRQRLFVAKAERHNTSADQLAFDAMFTKVQQLAKQLDAESERATRENDQATEKESSKPDKTPKGRRDLADTDLPVVRVEFLDPDLEGKAERIGFEESSRLGYERGGLRRIVLARAVYKIDPSGETSQTELTAPSTSSSDESPRSESASVAQTSQTPLATTSSGAELPIEIVTTPLPKELFRRCLLAPSMIAHVLAAKYMFGVPFYRLEQSFALQGAPLDRGTMCRYAEDAGATLGAIVEAARVEAFATAFCLSTDATGVSIQPGPLHEQERRPCRKGHFFVVLADRDHVFFEYQDKHTSAAVCAMFKGFTGYIQADASAVYDALFRGTQPRGQPPDPSPGPPPTEVGCWSHCRRNFWEAAVCKHTLGIEGLRRIDAIFAADRLLANLPPAQRKARRDVLVRPLVDAFFGWVDAERVTSRERGLVATALGYARNQLEPLRRFLEDGRLRLENNASERALRAIATARKSWLFFGSDDHASAAANLFSLVASCKLHGLDPESYLADVLRVMAYWPRNRYLELAPKYWAHTRARLDPAELARPLGHITVPTPLPTQQQTTPN